MAEHKVKEESFPVFVYGTLRLGGSAHKHFLDGCTHLGRDQLNASLYDMGWFPAIKFADPDDSVVGDLFEVCEGVLDSLDSYESHPSFYTRTLVTTEGGVKAWAYVFNGSVSESNHIPSGDWLGDQTMEIDVCA